MAERDASTRAITIRYLFALGILTVLTAGSYFLLHANTKAQLTNAALVNVSSRQRSLFERTGLLAMSLVSTQDPAVRGRLTEEILKAVSRMAKAHHGLVYGDPSLNLPGNPFPQARAIYFDPSTLLDIRFRNYLEEATTLAQAPPEELSSDNPHFRYVMHPASSRDLFNALDAVVNEYQKKSEADIARLQNLEKGMLGTTLFVLFMMGLIVFRPMVQRVREEMDKLKVLNETLEKRVAERSRVAEERARELEKEMAVRKWVEEALRKSEEESRHILGTAYDAFISADSNGSVTEWNHQAEIAFGWERSEVLGRSIAETVLPPQYQEAFRKGLREFLVTGQNPILNKRIEMTAFHRDGHDFSVEITIWATRVGDTHRFNAFIHNISDRKQAERLKDEFVSTVSHELRTPLTIIREGVSQVFDGILGETGADQKKVLSLALGGIDRLSRIIDDLLDMSKIEAGKVDLKRELLDIVPFAREVCATFEAHARNKGLEIRQSFPSEKGEVYIDRDRIIQVFTNLIGNALKFTDKGSIEVSVVNQDRTIECSVSDTGKGIPEEDLAKVFSKFQQFGREAGPGERGTGLGLAICKGIVELHSGKIWVESKLHQGCRFAFTIPKFTAKELFKEYVARGLKTAMRQGTALSLIVFNIQNFEGVLQQMGQEKVTDLVHYLEGLIKQSLRRKADIALKDTRAILVVLPETSKKDALGACGRIQQVLEGYLAKEGLKGEVEITSSVLSFPEDGATSEALLRGL